MSLPTSTTSTKCVDLEASGTLHVDQRTLRAIRSDFGLSNDDGSGESRAIDRYCAMGDEARGKPKGRMKTQRLSSIRSGLPRNMHQHNAIWSLAGNYPLSDAPYTRRNRYTLMLAYICVCCSSFPRLVVPQSFPLSSLERFFSCRSHCSTPSVRKCGLFLLVSARIDEFGEIAARVIAAPPVHRRRPPEMN